jgi:hypothetical protein
MKHPFIPTMLGLLVASAGTALAGNVHTSQAIGTTATGSATPGHAAVAPGSAFNPDCNAGTHYAGEQPQNSNNPKSVSQYDVAGFQQSHNH